MKTESRIAVEARIKNGLWELWLEFNESSEGRESVLEAFDEAIRRFSHKPKIAAWFARLKEIFLILENAETSQSAAAAENSVSFDADIEAMAKKNATDLDEFYQSLN